MIKKLKIPAVIKENFRFSTLSFLFIIAYVNIFQFIFGPENSIVGVIFSIMMSASMVRDLTAAPLRHFFIQAAVLVWMAFAACLVTILPALPGFAVNFITLSLILYAYTYEYSSHLYFPYILSYLFLMFISPVDMEHLPMRLLGMLTGAVSIIVYQLFMGRKRAAETAKDVLNEMIADIRRMISFRLGRTQEQPDFAGTRQRLCRLSQTVYDRRKKILCVSDASFSMIDAGRGLESLLLLVSELPAELSPGERVLLAETEDRLDTFQDYLIHENGKISEITLSGIPGSAGGGAAPGNTAGAENTADSEYTVPGDSEAAKTIRTFYITLSYIRGKLLHMADPKRRIHYRKTALSLKMQFQAALDYSPVRAVYAIRTALLLSCATLLVQYLELPHGKWLMFTLASVSLPYADDVPVKMKKRILATLIGGAVSVIIYSLVPSPAGRTAAMMLSGYISFYFSDYTETFACSTIGALGGAVFMTSFGFQDVGGIFLIRICYVVVGVVIGYLANCLIFPYSRAKATKQLWKRYITVTELLAKICSYSAVDTQLYYNLVIQAHLLEEKLTANAALEEWEDGPSLLAKCRDKVRLAHRIHMPDMSRQLTN